MKFKGGFVGVVEFKRRVTDMDKGSKEAVYKTIKELAYRISSTAIKSIHSGKKSGNVYKKRSGKTHTASAPGEAPASDSGNLAKNIYVQYDQEAMSATVIANTPYAATLEYGSRGVPGKNIPPLQPRPFMRPAFLLRTGQSIPAQLLKINWKEFK
jgi:phage gpG-like protein